MSKKITIVGGHGRHEVQSIIRVPDQISDIKEPGGKPLVLSLEEGSVADFSGVKTPSLQVEEGTKVYDAIEAMKGSKPKLIVVSAFDMRDMSKIPPHYDQEDIEWSEWMHELFAAYSHWKYEADKNLFNRTAFKWILFRPGTLTDEPGTGTANIGRTHLRPPISRDDVALALAILLDRDDAAGLGIDFVGGDTPVADGLDEKIKRGDTDLLG